MNLILDEETDKRFDIRIKEKGSLKKSYDASDFLNRSDLNEKSFLKNKSCFGFKVKKVKLVFPVSRKTLNLFL